MKNLQGYIWEDGYKTGAYSTPLFPDVAPKLQEWKDAGKNLAIYSSGSVFAQKLLFQHVLSEGGNVEDRTGLIDGWFDTVNAGLKTEAASYRKIVAALGVRAFPSFPIQVRNEKTLTKFLLSGLPRRLYS